MGYVCVQAGEMLLWGSVGFGKESVQCATSQQCLWGKVSCPGVVLRKCGNNMK